MFCRKNIVRIITFLLLVSMISSAMFVEIFAHTYSGGATCTTISPSKSQFKSAKSPNYSSKYQTISNCSISKQYDVNLYHYEAPVKGYYKIYSTGSADTVGTIFEEQNFLFFTTDYERKTNISDDDGDGQNFKIVTHFDIDEDYYIGVRCYWKKTGNYTLKIEPNDDLVRSKYGGVWTTDGSVGVTRKEYLNPYQVKEYYQMLRDKLTVDCIKNAYKKYGTEGTLEKLTSAGLTTFSLVDIAASVAKVPGAGSPIVGGLVLIGELALGYIFDSIYTDTDQTAYIMGILTTLCGAGYVRKKGVDVYNDPHCGLLITSGVELKTVKNIYGQKFLKSQKYDTYSRFYGDTLTGVAYKKGTWG